MVFVSASSKVKAPFATFAMWNQALLVSLGQKTLIKEEGKMAQSKGHDTSNRGFASMDEKKRREIASKGGHSVPPEERSFAKDPELAAEAGKKGGKKQHAKAGQQSHKNR